MTPNLTSSKNFYFESLSRQGNEPLDLTLGFKPSDSHILKSEGHERDRLEGVSSREKLLSKNESVSLRSAIKRNVKISRKQKLSFAKKWLKSYVSHASEATLTFYAIFLAYIQFCSEKNEVPLAPLELLHLLQIELVQVVSGVDDHYEDEKELDDSASEEVLSAISDSAREEFENISKNVKFQSVILKTEKDDAYSSDSCDSAVSSLGYDEEDSEYHFDSSQNVSDKDSAYDSTDESPTGTLASSANETQESSTFPSKLDDAGRRYVLCISSPNHINKGIKVQPKNETSQDVQIIRVAPNGSLRSKRKLENDDENSEVKSDDNGREHSNKKSILQVVPGDTFEIKKEPVNSDEFELAESQNQDKESNCQVHQAMSDIFIIKKELVKLDVVRQLSSKTDTAKQLRNKVDFVKQPNSKEFSPPSKSQIFQIPLKDAVRAKRKQADFTGPRPDKQQKSIKVESLTPKEVQWSKSQELIIDSVANLLSLQGFENSPCYKDAKGFANTLVEMLRNKQLKLFLTAFGHAMSCNEKHGSLCFMFKRIIHHITRSQHSCAVKFIYGHVLRLHLDTCKSDKCGFHDCKKLRHVRNFAMVQTEERKQ